MFGSQILEVAIGLILVYLLLSLICSAMREGIESFEQLRSVSLERGIRELLQDPEGLGLTQSIYNHPQIYGLFQGEYDPRLIKNGNMPKRSKLPAYIPARNFALALLDVAARGPHTRATSAVTYSPALSLDNARAGVAQIDNPAVQRMLLTAFDTARGNLQVAQKNVEAWFDSGMDRVSGWYKKRTQMILFLLGIGTAVVINVDTITIAQALYREDVLRAATVAAAERVSTDTTLTPSQAYSTLRSIQLPIGWPRTNLNPDLKPGWTWVSSLIGWLLTGLAVSLGAPFWFDLLNKIMIIRSTVKPHEKSPEEGSEDRQPKAQAGAEAGAGALLLPAPEVAAAFEAAAGPGPAPPPPPERVTAPAGAPAAGTDFKPQQWADGHADEGIL
jgi:hypothetical protein